MFANALSCSIRLALTFCAGGFIGLVGCKSSQTSAVQSTGAEAAEQDTSTDTAKSETVVLRAGEVTPEGKHIIVKPKGMKEAPAMAGSAVRIPGRDMVFEPVSIAHSGPMLAMIQGQTFRRESDEDSRYVLFRNAEGLVVQFTVHEVAIEMEIKGGLNADRYIMAATNSAKHFEKISRINRFTLEPTKGDGEGSIRIEVLPDRDLDLKSGSVDALIREKNDDGDFQIGRAGIHCRSPGVGGGSPWFLRRK